MLLDCCALAVVLATAALIIWGWLTGTAAALDDDRDTSEFVEDWAPRPEIDPGENDAEDDPHAA
jgi:hypothetical protein